MVATAQHRQWRQAAGITMPVLAGLATFCPWIDFVAPDGSHAGQILQQFSAYGLSPLTWGWLLLDVLVVAAAVVDLVKPQPSWIRWGSVLYAAVSLGVGVSGPGFLEVARKVSNLLQAPNPVRLGYGVYVFGAITLIWVIFGIDARKPRS